MPDGPVAVDRESLAREGFVRLPGLVDGARVEAFEATIAKFSRAEAARRGIEPRWPDPLADLLLRGGPYRVTLFGLLKNLQIVQRLGADIGDRLADFLEAEGFEVPLVWPTLRADVPGEDTYLLPMHSDFASTRCNRAWRLWIPLRDANAERGTMRVVVGSHCEGPFPYDQSDPARPFVAEQHYRHLRVETLELRAGDGVLFDPNLLHASVPGHSDRMKFVLLVQAQDLASLGDPNDPADPTARAEAITREREAARRQQGLPCAEAPAQPNPG